MEMWITPEVVARQTPTFSQRRIHHRPLDGQLKIGHNTPDQCGWFFRLSHPHSGLPKGEPKCFRMLFGIRNDRGATPVSRKLSP